MRRMSSPPANYSLPARPPVLSLAIVGLLLLFMLLSLCMLASQAAPAVSRYQHNIWYNGLFISGIAVNDTTGDVFYSDSAGNRIIRQAANGTLLNIYRAPADGYALFSPMQLALYQNTLYVADSSNNRVGVVDVDGRGDLRFLPQSTYLTSCTALDIDSSTGDLYVVDGWGLKLHMWSTSSQSWSETRELNINSGSPPPRFISCTAMYGTMPWLADPLRGFLYSTSFVVGTGGVSPRRNVSDVVSFRSPRQYTFYFLQQAAPDAPVRLQTNQFLAGTNWTWTSPSGAGGGAMPFYAWALFVDSNLSTYLTDHGTDPVVSPYGRVVRVDSTGNATGNWSMADGKVYSFSSVWHDDTSAALGPCSMWMTEPGLGLVRVASDGTVLQSWLAEVDPSDNRTAVFTSVQLDAAATSTFPSWGLPNTTLVLLDNSSPTQSKLWRFYPVNHTFVLMNTTAANLSANIASLTVHPIYHIIFVTDADKRTVLCLTQNGELDPTFNISGVGFVEPLGIATYFLGEGSGRVIVADAGYQNTGAVIVLGTLRGDLIGTYQPDRMYRPLSVAADINNGQLYAADSNGLVFQLDWVTLETTLVHQPVPAATHIRSMTVTHNGLVYMLDLYSRRLIVLLWQSPPWNPGPSACAPPLPPAAPLSSSSSSSTAMGYLSSSTSSSSANSSPPTSPASFPLPAVVVPIVAGVMLAAGAVAVLRCRFTRDRALPKHERLAQLFDVDEQQRVEHEEVKEQKVEKDKFQQKGDEPPTSKTASDVLELRDGCSSGVRRPRISAGNIAALAEAEQAGGVSSRRPEWIDYYVQRYEVVAALKDVFVDRWDKRQSVAMRSARSNQPQAIPVSMSPAASVHSATPSTSAELVASYPPSTFDISSSLPSSASSSSSSLASYLSSRKPNLTKSSSEPSPSLIEPPRSPSHIAELTSVLHTAPIIVQSVKDLTILGEGNSGRVYAGYHPASGAAVVVKLPKAVNISGATWREWHCHIRIPPDPHLVSFLGALPMESTNYLVTALVRQGSLHGLLTSSSQGSWYSRPYGVLRCAREMAAVLCHMHSSGFVHRDVSCRNVLVDSDGRYVLADLGLAQQLGSKENDLSAMPVRWTSPESLAFGTHTDKSDVWSLGVTLWEMTAGGRQPYSDFRGSTQACIQPIVTGQLTLEVNEQWGMDCGPAERRLAASTRSLIGLCLTFDAQLRSDSRRLVDVLDAMWAEWQSGRDGACNNEAAAIEQQWREYHRQVQSRLGPTKC